MAGVLSNFFKKKEDLVIGLILIGFFSLLLFNRGYISGFAVDLNQYGSSADGFFVTIS
ncbi:hypothetical protein HYX16_01595 [Candidatus Woesearchaeota archaeon]|nr:hypothetical protein [Candidatus Woesearchaeota archaeon]